MDSVLPACKSFDDFLAALEAAGVEIKRGKQLAFKLPGGKKFSRQDTLGDDYSLEAILERISGKRVVEPKQKSVTLNSPRRFNIDIQEKMQQGYGEGFDHYARLKNLKDMAKTLIFLKENNLTDYDLLVKTAEDSKSYYNGLCEKTKANSQRMAEISELQKQMGTYGNIRNVYKQYLNAKNRDKFFEEHRADVTLHIAAKKYFDESGYGRNNALPSMASLKQEYAILAAENKKLYPEQKQAKEKMIDLLMAKQNVDMFFGKPRQPSKSHYRDAR